MTDSRRCLQRRRRSATVVPLLPAIRAFRSARARVALRTKGDSPEGGLPRPARDASFSSNSAARSASQIASESPRVTRRSLNSPTERRDHGVRIARVNANRVRRGYVRHDLADPPRCCQESARRACRSPFARTQPARAAAAGARRGGDARARRHHQRDGQRGWPGLPHRAAGSPGAAPSLFCVSSSGRISSQPGHDHGDSGIS